jgi:uncharacterized protein YbbC (DUF1343 family)
MGERRSPRVTLGCERLAGSGRLRGRRVGIVSNPASVDSRLRHVVDRVTDGTGATLAALFGPQHGFHADVQDNMIETRHASDPARRVPVYSLYSDTREPTADMLAGLDLLVIDLQDVGTRVYTYVYTVANCLRACRRHGVPVVVCDRPNPIGGEAVEGPVLDPAYASFVGQFPIPLRHGMTIGELAHYFNDRFEIGADLEVVPMEGWRRQDHHDDTGLPWVMPSPNIPTLDSAIVYPGAVLFEGTNVSEGRGTTRPFELLGAPWIDGPTFADRMNEQGLPGVYFRPVFFEPTFQKHAGRTCGGCQVHVLDRRSFLPVLTAVALLRACYRSEPAAFAWREPPYEYEFTRRPIDVLAGTDELRRQIEGPQSPEDITASWEPRLAAFRSERERYLLY